MIKKIDNGICAPKGFKASGIHCGIKADGDTKDLALIVSDAPADTAAVYTTNLVKGAPIPVTQKHIANGKSIALIANSGNANTCNADGIEVAEEMCSIAAGALGIDAEDVVVASTGVIGQPMDVSPIRNKIDELVSGLKEDTADAAAAIMTTDTIPKIAAVSFEIDGKECRLGGIAKGSGMIHPNMATMLVFLTTDCAISTEMLQKAINKDVETTFNNTSVDGDTSTNDMLVIMANGMAENRKINAVGPEYYVFKDALHRVTSELCKMIAGDGEGATKLIECIVTGAKDITNARKVAKSVVCSSLVKAAMFGEDANWGRILCAIGYSGADVDVNKIDVSFRSEAGELPVCVDGAGIGFDEDVAARILHEKEIDILVDLKEGAVQTTAYGCDLTYDYVKINGEYRS